MDGKKGISSWPKDERPREKLFQWGEHRLSNAELLAILLRTGTRGESALDLARRVLMQFGTLRNMSHTGCRDWKRIKGLGEAKIAQIKAALEIGRRFGEEQSGGALILVQSAQDVARLMMPRLRDLKKEIFKAVYLNSQNRILAIEEIEEGTVNQASPMIREIFAKALDRFAVSVICVHNHPSGDPSPSVPDTVFTERLLEAGKVLQVKVLDHLIIGDNVYYSFSRSARAVIPGAKIDP